MDLSPDTIFRLANGVALLGWLALLASPPAARWSGKTWRLTGRALPLAFSVLYVAMLAVHWPAGGGFGSPSQVRALFDEPGALVAGWVHYLAFDLFVGTWIASRAAALGWRHWQVMPVLVLTFLFGPAGLLAFMALRLLREPLSSMQSPGAPS